MRRGRPLAQRALGVGSRLVNGWTSRFGSAVAGRAFLNGDRQRSARFYRLAAKVIGAHPACRNIVRQVPAAASRIATVSMREAR
jgi:hypothetical protein